MDLWTRLISGGRNPKGQHQHSVAQTPQQRLQRFRRAFNPIQQLATRSHVIAANPAAIDQLRSSLHRIIALFREESRTPVPHLCLSFAASSQVYNAIARTASASQDRAILRDAVTIFGILVDSEEEQFLTSAAFAKYLIRFATRIIDSGLSEDIEADLIEVLFGVAAKIRIQPDILAVWFTDLSSTHTASADPVADATDTTKPQPFRSHDNAFVGATQKDGFPLCYLLIDHIHHDGRTGDFARTGLLYIFETISHSKPLEDWILASDLPTLMASGLGALYSQLSRELSIRHDTEHLPLMLALSDYEHLQQVSSSESIFSASYASHMSTFLSHLTFWQDVLEHCKSVDVKQTLLDHFQILFLQQLLYPSLLQSSDTDAGSSVAVLVYVANILESLDHPDLVRMILEYLLAMPGHRLPTSSSPSSSDPPRSPTVDRRRSSLMLLNQASNDEDKLEPALFSLVDLILNGVKSRNPQTVVASLKLSTVLLNRHTDYTTRTLLKSEVQQKPHAPRSIGALSAETNALLRLAAIPGDEQGFAESYADALQDVAGPLELRLVSRLRQHPQSPSKSKGITSPPLCTLMPNDPYLDAISRLFDSFLTNSIDINLSLTEVVINLALCTDISLDGWLAVPSSNYHPTTPTPQHLDDDMHGLDEDERVSFLALQAVYREPSTQDMQDPLLISLLRSLDLQLEAIRNTIKNVDMLVAKRQQILGGLDDEGTDNGVTLQPPVTTLSLDRDTDGAHSSLTDRGPRTLVSPGSLTGSPSPSPARSRTPSRLRNSTKPLSTRAKSPSNLQPGLGSVPKVIARRLSHTIFQPPPPDVSDVTDDSPASQRSGTVSPKVWEHEAETLRRTLRFRRRKHSSTNSFQFVPADIGNDDDGGGGGGGGGGDDGLEFEERSASVSHVLTNVVVLQHFILELVAVMRMRATLCEEVAFAQDHHQVGN